MTDNLININDRPDKNELQRAGGIASGKSKRRKKALRERLATALEMPATSIEAVEALRNAGMEEGTYYDALTASMILGAIRGNPACLKLITDIMGETAADRRADAADLRSERALQLKEKQFEKTGSIDGASIAPTVITVHKDGSLDIHGGLENAPILVDNMEFMK